VLYYIMNGLSLLNLNVLRIPSAACATPNVSFLDLFNGITLGVTGLALYMVAMWACGSVYARAAALPDASVAHFNRVSLGRLLLFLDVLYAPMSQVIVGMFRCLRIGDDYWLYSDLSVQCYTARHMRYWHAAVFWALFFSLGVPVLFVSLLFYYRVPAAAAALRRTLLLRALIDAAQQRGAALPLLEVPLADVTPDSLSDDYVAALYEDAFPDPDAASDASDASSVAAPSEDAETALTRSDLLVNATVGPDGEPRLDTFSLAADAQAPPPRAAQLARLLARAEVQHGPGLPAYGWDALQPAHDGRLPGVREAIGALYNHYTPSRWYWKIVEVLHRFLLTCGLAFIAPGTGAQVFSGVAISLFVLLLYSFMLPHEARSVARSAYNAHLCILLLFLTGLLLKMGVRFAPDDTRFFGAVVGVLVCALFVVPALVAAHASGVHAAAARRLRRCCAKRCRRD
jgi:hypothetical protein